MVTASQRRHVNRLVARGFPLAKAIEIASGPFAGLATVGLKTDTTYLAGRGTLLDQFGDDPVGRADLEYRINQAAKAGFRPGVNDVYDPTLASSPGSPEGWIPHDSPKAHIRKVLRKRLGQRHRKRVPLAEKIIQREMKRRVAENPDNAHKPVFDLRAEIIEKHAYKPNQEEL